MDIEATLGNPSSKGTAEKRGAKMAPLSIYLTQVPVVRTYSVIITRLVKLAAPNPFFSLAVFGIGHLLTTIHFFKVEEDNPYI